MHKIAIALFVSLNIIGQKTLPKSEYLIAYKKGVQAIANKDFTAGKDILLPLTQQKYSYAVSPYAMYYHALASIKLKKGFEARLMLKQLLERYPEWSKTDEALFLYADAYLLDGYYAAGIEALNKIDQKDIRQQTTDLCYSHFSKLKLNELKQFNSQYTANAGIALALVQKIQSSKPSKADLTLSDQLIRQHDLYKYLNKTKNTSKPNIETANVSKKLAAGVLFPFDIKTNRKKIAENTLYLYDYYDGLLMAQQKLAEEGIAIELYAFEVDRSASSMEKLIQNQDFNRMDLIFGPLYPEPNNMAQGPISSGKIVQIHPFSNNQDLVLSEKSILAQPSFSTIAASTVSAMKGRTLHIIYLPTRKDSTLAEHLKIKALEKGINAETRAFSVTENIFTATPPANFFISGSDATKIKEISQFLIRKYPKSAIFTNGFDENETFENKNLFLIKTNRFDEENTAYQDFKLAYTTKRGKLPSEYVAYGYDQMLFYGRTLAKYPGQFNFGLSLYSNQQNLVSSGFKYNYPAVDNQTVEIGQIKNGRFEPISY